MNKRIQLNAAKQQPIRDLGAWQWFLFGILTAFFRIIELFLLGASSSHFDYAAAAGIEAVLTLISWAFIRHAIPYVFIVWFFLFWTGICLLVSVTDLFLQPAIGNELIPLGWKGNFSIVAMLMAYLLQIALLLQCLFAHREQEV